MSNLKTNNIVLTNSRIVQFYKKYPNLNPEALNLLLIDLLEKLNNDLSNDINSTVQNEILSSVSLISQKFDSLNDSISSNNNSIIVKFHEINKEFLDNIKHLLGNTISSNTDKVEGLLDKNTNLFYSKIDKLIPENNKSLSLNLRQELESVQKSILCDIKNNSQSTEKIDSFISSIDSKISNIQQPIFTFMTSNHEQIQNHFSSLRENNAKTYESQEKVFKGLEDFLNKYKTSSSLKGQFSENMLEGILNNMFPSSEIINMTSTKASGDFMLKRLNYYPILFENKNYDANVNSEEVKKFIRDIKEQSCHGIFMSQNSGIVNKTNYSIEIHEGFIGVFLHNVDYNIDKIKTAIDIIDNLAIKLKDFNFDGKESLSIDKKILDSINSEYQLFASQKETLINTVREIQKKLLNQIDDLKMPDLQLYLSGKYGSIQTSEFTCEICGEVFAKKSGLASHKKVHKNKQPIIEINTTT